LSTYQHDGVGSNGCGRREGYSGKAVLVILMHAASIFCWQGVGRS